MRKEFEMSQSEMDEIIQINKSQNPVMKIGNGWSGLDLQEQINNYWEKLGKKYFFDPLTVQPYDGRTNLWFTAEAIEIETDETIISKAATEWMDSKEFDIPSEFKREAFIAGSLFWKNRVNL